MIYLKPMFANNIKRVEKSYKELISQNNTTLQKMVMPQSFEEYVKELKSKNTYVYNILTEDTKYSKPKHVGNISLCDIDLLNRKAKISIFIWSKEQRKGYGSLAIQKLTELCFSRMNLHRLEAHTAGNNHACICAFRKAEYEVETNLKDAIFFKGKYDFLTILRKIKEEV